MPTSAAVEDDTGHRYAPGARVEIRDEEWMVRSVQSTATGGHALRVIGVYLARSTKAVDPKLIGDGYVFADYGPAGGDLLILSSAATMVLLGTAQLPPADADVLWRAADPPGGIAAVDAILKRALGAIATT